MTEDNKLTPEDSISIEKWNNIGSATTDAAMRRFLVPWFENARELIRADFPIHSIEEIVTDLSKINEDIVVLGSGPSMDKVLDDITGYNHICLCGPTNVAAMALHGKRPRAIVVADSNPLQYEILRDLRSYWLSSTPVILPVTASPLWYSKDSVFDRENLYFYLPYVTHLNDIDYPFNHILKALFPSVNRWIAQAGSVSNTMLTVAEMIRNESAGEPCVYVGVDCCGWLTDPPIYRSPSAVNDRGTLVRREVPWHKAQIDAIRSDAIAIKSDPFDLETTVVSLGYAIQMLYLIHNYTSANQKETQYVLIEESSRLFNTLCDGIVIPEVPANEIGYDELPPYETAWAYKAMLKLIKYVTERYVIKEAE